MIQCDSRPPPLSTLLMNCKYESEPKRMYALCFEYVMWNIRAIKIGYRVKSIRREKYLKIFKLLEIHWCKSS